MLIVTERGESFRVNNDDVPEPVKEWLYNKAYVFHDDIEMEDCWVADVCKQDVFHSNSGEYEFAGGKVFDHEPTNEELYALMGKHDALRYSYVTVTKAKRLHEEFD